MFLIYHSKSEAKTYDFLQLQSKFWKLGRTCRHVMSLNEMVNTLHVNRNAAFGE